MQRTQIAVAMLVSMFVLQNAALAEVGLSAKVGTLGIGADLTVGLFDQLNTRLGFAFANYDVNRNEMDNRYVSDIGVELEWRTISLLLDWHPFSNGFRISAGGIVNQNKVTLSAKPSQTVSIDDQEFAVSSLDGDITFPQFVPYVGIGYGNAGKADEDTHFRFSFDLGAMFQGAGEVALKATAVNSALQSALDNAVEGQIDEYKDDVESFKIYPVISFGVSYVF